MPIVPARDLPSRALYQGRDRAAARSFLHAIGLTAEDIGKPFIGVGLKAEDIGKPFIGVSNCWLETMPCNFGLRELAVPLKAGIRAAGANPMEFNTIAAPTPPLPKAEMGDDRSRGHQGRSSTLPSPPDSVVRRYGS